MERQKKIIDASIIVKWFANEDGSDKAIKLRDQHISEELTLIVPEFVFLEVLNALKYKKVKKEYLEKASKDFLDFQLEVVHLDEFLLKKAIGISIEYDLSIYDSVYASLAQIHGTQLITEDDKLLKFPNALSLKKV